MNARSMSMVIVGLFALAGAAKVLATENEIDKLRGTWVPVAVKNGDEPAQPEDLEKVSLKIDGNKFKLLDRDSSTEGTIQLDSTASPKTFDAVIPDDKFGDIRVVGIYKLEGDTLTFRFDSNSVSRPADFESASDTATLIVWKRVQP